MCADRLGCSFESKTRSRSPISSRIAVLSFESRLRAFLWGIALLRAIYPARIHQAERRTAVFSLSDGGATAFGCFLAGVNGRARPQRIVSGAKSRRSFPSSSWVECISGGKSNLKIGAVVER